MSLESQIEKYIAAAVETANTPKLADNYRHFALGRIEAAKAITKMIADDPRWHCTAGPTEASGDD